MDDCIFPYFGTTSALKCVYNGCAAEDTTLEPQRDWPNAIASQGLSTQNNGLVFPCRPQFYEPVFMLLLGTVQVQEEWSLWIFQYSAVESLVEATSGPEWWCLNHWIFFQSFKTVAEFQGLSNEKAFSESQRCVWWGITVDKVKADWQERTHFLVRMAFLSISLATAGPAASSTN